MNHNICNKNKDTNQPLILSPITIKYNNHLHKQECLAINKLYDKQDGKSRNIHHK